jgi:hypothetical protein
MPSNEQPKTKLSNWFKGLAGRDKEEGKKAGKQQAVAPRKSTAESATKNTGNATKRSTGGSTSAQPQIEQSGVASKATSSSAKGANYDQSSKWDDRPPLPRSRGSLDASVVTW